MMRNKRGSVLIFVLIVFAVSSVLAIGVFTRLIYSQNENRMQIGEQQAYYAAKSAVDATISYFIDQSTTSTSIDNPTTLVGKRGKGTLVNPETGVESQYEVEITREGTQIKIIGRGYYLNETKEVVAYLDEKKSVGGLFNNDTVLAAGDIKISYTNLEGAMYLENTASYASFNIDKIRTKDPIYIRANQSNITLQNSELEDVYIEIKNGGIDFDNNKPVNNFYLLLKEGQNFSKVNENQILGTALIYSPYNIDPSIFGNVISHRMLLYLNSRYISQINSNTIKNLYIRGVHKLIRVFNGKVTDPIQNLYTDAVEIEYAGVDHTLEDNPEKPLPETIAKEMEMLPHQITNTLDGFSDLKQYLSGIYTWEEPTDREPILETYVFKEYDFPELNARVVFVKEGQWIAIRKGMDKPEGNNYYVDSSNGRRTFIVGSQYGGIQFYFNAYDEVEDVYVYSPYEMCKFEGTMPKRFEGSMLARQIIGTGSIDAYSQFVYKPAGNIGDLGAPSVGSIGSEYTYTASTPLYRK